MREASVWNFKILLEKLVRVGATRQKTRRPENLADTDVLHVPEKAACTPPAVLWQEEEPRSSLAALMWAGKVTGSDRDSLGAPASHLCFED